MRHAVAQPLEDSNARPGSRGARHGGKREGARDLGLRLRHRRHLMSASCKPVVPLDLVATLALAEQPTGAERLALLRVGRVVDRGSQYISGCSLVSRPFDDKADSEGAPCTFEAAGSIHRGFSQRCLPSGLDAQQLDL